jgi:hypothetical protein
MQELRNFLAILPPGSIAAPSHLERILASSCHDFEYSNQENMKAGELKNREIEEVEWKPPTLSFTIQRYRVTLLGSATSERQRWAVNVDTKETLCYNAGSGQTTPSQPPLNVEPIVKEVVRLIKNHQKTEWLKWQNDGSVHVVMGKVFPVSTNLNKHLRWQRERFRTKVEESLTTACWMKIKTNHYAPSQSHEH